MAVMAGLDEETGIRSKVLEAHYLSRGNVPLVIRAMIAAAKAKIINLTFEQARAIDLAGRNVLEAVQTSVYPKVIDCPPKDTARPTLDAVAKDGIQLKVKARVTVRANLERLIGGATEETIIARVGEGIVSAIGSAASHKNVLENPDLISKAVLVPPARLADGLRNRLHRHRRHRRRRQHGARLQADQAEADTRVARARAEGRRAMAAAAEQEMIAKIEESRAALVEAEAQVPKAIAEAFKEGKLGIMDYFRLRNVQSDTDMRRAIAGSGSSGSAIG